MILNFPLNFPSSQRRDITASKQDLPRDLYWDLKWFLVFSPEESKTKLWLLRQFSGIDFRAKSSAYGKRADDEIWCICTVYRHLVI